MRTCTVTFVLIYSLPLSPLFGQPAGKTDRLFQPEALQEDFRIFRGILETYHPGLYRFTTPEQWQVYFDQTSIQLQEAQSETAFANLLAYLINKIRCGHTSLITSKAGIRLNQPLKTPAFPLRVKVWRDSVATLTMPGHSPPLVPPGSILTSINGNPATNAEQLRAAVASVTERSSSRRLSRSCVSAPAKRMVTRCRPPRLTAVLKGN